MRFFCFALLFVLALSCSNSRTKRSQLIHYIPETATIIVKTENIEGLFNSLSNNDFITSLKKDNIYNSFLEKLEFTSLIKPNGKTLIGLNKNKKDSLEITLVTKNHKALFLRDSLSNYIEETLKYDGKVVIKSNFKNQLLYSTIIDSVFIASTNKLIVDDAYVKTKLNEDLERIYNTVNSNKSASIIMKAENPFMNFIFLNDSLKFKKFTNYVAVDAEINQNSIKLNGITKDVDSTASLINIFKNTVPQENQMAFITPANSDGFMSLTFSEFSTFYSNLIRFNETDSLAIKTQLFDNIIEVGLVYNGNDRAVVLYSIDEIATSDALLADQNIIDVYRQTDIFSFSETSLFSNVFHPFINSNDLDKYCKLDSYYIFATNMNLLQNIITNYQNKTTLSERSYYQNIYENLSDASSLLYVVNENALSSIASKNFGNEPTFKLDDYKASALQFIYDKDFAHVNGIIQRDKGKTYDNSVSEEFSIKLDADLLNAPQFVKNHITNQKEVVVQDINNNLYLISNQGKMLWKKQLHGPVLGKIEQIDIYKNGRLQLVFATPHRLYVLDRNGKDVAPFPGKFNDEISQPLSVFDYDKKKNYRFLVTQGNHVLMFNTKAKTVSGFIFKKANGTINSQPQHFKIGSKDYLTIKTKDKLYILDRTGRNRVTPKSNSSFSNESIYWNDNAFTTTTVDGNLISIDTKGNTKIENINLSENHHIDASTKTLVTHSENKLNIRDKSLELDYGNYTVPKFFYIDDKIYVSITDLQAQKVYLFDSQAKSIPNFPVYGNSTIELDNIDKDNNLEFVTKGDSDTILLYQIN